MSWELYLPPAPRQRLSNGRFVKGHTPWTTGKSWNEWLPKRKQKKIIRIATANLRKYRPRKRPDIFDKCRKEVIALTDDGRIIRFKCLNDAAEYVGGNFKNVSRCCISNQSNRINQKTGAININHKYKGVRFYFANDNNLFKSLDNGY